jgi:hypothetical protein
MTSHRKRQREEPQPIIIKEEPMSPMMTRSQTNKEWIKHEDILNNFIPGLDTNTVMQYKAVYEIILDLERQHNDLLIYKRGRLTSVEEDKAKALAKIEEHQMKSLMRIEQERKEFEHMHAVRMQDIHKDNLLTMQKLREYQEYFLQVGQHVIDTVKNMRESLHAVTNAEMTQT